MADLAFKETFDQISSRVRAGIAAGQYGFGVEFESGQASRATLNDRNVVMLTSNNYLGLADHPAVVDACARALRTYGSGTCGARLHNGTTVLHRNLEKKVAAWLGYEDVVMFSSGYLANLGTISAIVDTDTTVVIDQLNHMSIIDGCKLAEGQTRIFTHNDMQKLEYALARATTRKRLVVVDGVYSMEGEIAPLVEIQRLAERYDAMLMVDEAHALGVLGAEGRGAASHHGIRPDILMGAFSKTLAGGGGFVATGQAAADFLRHSAHAYIFNAAGAPSVVAGVDAAFDIMVSEPWRIDRLWSNTIRFRAGLMAAGFDVMNSVTPIVPIAIGDDDAAMRMAVDLLVEDVYISAAIFPAVPHGKSRFRATITAALEPADIDYALDALTRAGIRHGVIQ